MTGPILFIDNHQISSVEVDGTLIGQLQVTATGSLATTSTAVTVGSAVNVQVDGGVYSEVDAIYGSSADDTTIIVGALGTVGINGVYLGGSGNIVLNNGGISGSLSVKDCAAIKLDSSENYLLNTGYLSGYYGIFATGLVSPADQNLIVNSGTIQASAVGIRLVEDHSFGPSSPSKSMALSDYGVFTSGSIIAGEVGIEITHAGHVKNTGLVQAAISALGTRRSRPVSSTPERSLVTSPITAPPAAISSSTKAGCRARSSLTRTTTMMAASALRPDPSTWEAATTPPMAATASKRSSAVSATT